MENKKNNSCPKYRLPMCKHDYEERRNKYNIPCCYKKRGISTQQKMFEKFKEHFKDDILGYILNQGIPKFRVITAGGYGMKTLLEEKYNLYDKVHTSDVDFTVSTWKSSMNAKECFNYWYEKINVFINMQKTPSDFDTKIIYFGHEHVPIMNYNRDYVIMVSYKKTDFVDIAITDFPITDSLVEKEVSINSGIPVKHEEDYLKEFLTLIYMENVPGVNKYCYLKRNPVTGELMCKGTKDIERSKILCDIQKTQKYKKYCQLLTPLTIEKLKKMPKEDRDNYFQTLKELIYA